MTGNITYGRLWHEYAELWDKMVVNPSRVDEFDQIAEYAFLNRQKYLVVEENTGVPWPLIACFHKRESDAQDKHGNPLFTSYLGNGQPLNKRTTIEPIGRGPFPTFEAGAIDALKYDKLTLVVEWRLEKQIYYGELLNGFGNRFHGVRSSYLWGGTNNQQKGKFIRDHVFDSSVLDKQPGLAPMLKAIWELEPDMFPKRED